MWFKRFSPSKAFENTCAVCNSKYLDSPLTSVGYWDRDNNYEMFPLAAQSLNGFHGENCQYECAVCLNGGKCVHSPHPYRYSYTIENTFKEQNSAIYPTTTCLCSSNVYDAAHMCCPNGFQPYVYHGKRTTIPYSRFTMVPYVTSVDNNIDLGYYRDIDLTLEKDITFQYVEPANGMIPVGVGTKIVEEGAEASFSLVGPYNKHVYHGTTKEICRACPGLFGKGVRAVGDFIETEQAAEGACSLVRNKHKRASTPTSKLQLKGPNGVFLHMTSKQYTYIYIYTRSAYGAFRRRLSSRVKFEAMKRRRMRRRIERQTSCC